MQTRRNAGIGFAQATSGGVKANLRLSRASLAKSCATIRLIQPASTLRDCQLEPPLPPSWEQRTRICTRQSAYIPALPAGPPLIFPPHLSRCDRVAGPTTE